MLVFTRAMKMAAAAVSLAVMLLGAATPSQAQTTGQVRLHIVQVGFIVGVGGGSGVLIFHGHRYRLSVSGIGIGSLGIAAVDLVGTASNLTSPGAIAGTYAGAGAGGAFVGGARWRRCRTPTASFSRCRAFRPAFRSRSVSAA